MALYKKEIRIERFLDIINSHPQRDTLEIDMSSFTNTNNTVKCFCKKHKIEFEAKPNVLRVQKGGCMECCEEMRLEKQNAKMLPRFLTRAKKIHGDSYDYSKVRYVNSTTPVEIVCPVHGSFFQSPSIHTYDRCGCKYCAASYGEKLIAQILRVKDIKYEFQHWIRIDGANYYFDFYLPDYNLFIEYDGRQHFQPVKWFGGEEGFRETQRRDAVKNSYAESQGMRMLRIAFKDRENILSILNDYFRQYP